MSGIFDQIINYAPPSLLLGTVTYKGTWSAATNTPTLVDPPSAITNGNYYVVDAAGTQFTLVFNIGDWIISNGSTWEKVDNTDAISSVFGRTGAVVGVSTDYSSVGITNTALGASNPSTVAATTVTATSTIAATGAVTGSNLSGTNTGDQTISLTGGVTGSGTGSFAATVVTNADLTGDVTSVGNATTLTNAPVIAKVLTGYSSGAGTVAATDSILQAIQKLDGNDSTNADLTGVITSSGNATSIASQTGTGTKFVVDTSPTLVTPNIGVATGTSLAAALNGSLGATTPSTVAATTISGTTLTSTVSGTEVDFVLGNNTAGRRMELGTNSGGHGYLKLRNASNTETITANAGSGLSITGTLSASTTASGGVAIGSAATAAYRMVDISQGTVPGFTLQNTGQAADNRIWDFTVYGTSFRGRITADNLGSDNPWLDVARSGTTVSSITHTAGSGVTALTSTGLAVTGTGSFSGNVGIGGASVSNALDVNGDIRVQGGNRAIKFNNTSVEFSCTGALSKGSGSFRIEHPLPSKSATHELVHSFIEGPKCDLIYRGKIDLVDGKATVNIDTDSTMTEGTFEALCATVQCFTSNESGWGAIRGKVVGNILTIEAQDAASTDSVSWMVIGERKDPHIMDTDWTDENGRPIVEPLKPVVESK
jgi:hypothetical protein